MECPALNYGSITLLRLRRPNGIARARETSERNWVKVETPLQADKLNIYGAACNTKLSEWSRTTRFVSDIDARSEFVLAFSLLLPI